jgi:hypothetical protein
VSLNEETEWTVMLLAGTRNTQRDFRIRTVDPGPSGVDRKSLEAIGLAVTGLWRLDRYLSEFVERFSEGIAEKRVRAKLVKLAPPRLAEMTPRQRAEEYLDFADRGSPVAFDKAPDLTAEEFSRFMTYIPD